MLRAELHLADAPGVRLGEAKRGAATVAEGFARDQRRVGREAVIVADVAPEVPQEDLETAVLVAGASRSVH